MEANAEAMGLFLAVQTQWRAGPAGVIGLDYGQVRAMARDMDILMTPGMWRKIRALEFAELSDMHKESGDDPSRGDH